MKMPLMSLCDKILTNFLFILFLYIVKFLKLAYII